MDENTAFPVRGEDERNLKKIRTSYQASDGVYGSPRDHRDLRDDGERNEELRIPKLRSLASLCGEERRGAFLLRRPRRHLLSGEERCRTVRLRHRERFIPRQRDSMR